MPADPGMGRSLIMGLLERFTAWIDRADTSAGPVPGRAGYDEASRLEARAERLRRQGDAMSARGQNSAAFNLWRKAGIAEAQAAELDRANGRWA